MSINKWFLKSQLLLVVHWSLFSIVPSIKNGATLVLITLLCVCWDVHGTHRLGLMDYELTDYNLLPGSKLVTCSYLLSQLVSCFLQDNKMFT